MWRAEFGAADTAGDEPRTSGHGAFHVISFAGGPVGSCGGLLGRRGRLLGWGGGSGRLRAGRAGLRRPRRGARGVRFWRLQAHHPWDRLETGRDGLGKLGCGGPRVRKQDGVELLQIVLRIFQAKPARHAVVGIGLDQVLRRTGPGPILLGEPVVTKGECVGRAKLQQCKGTFRIEPRRDERESVRTSEIDERRERITVLIGALIPLEPFGGIFSLPVLVTLDRPPYP